MNSYSFTHLTRSVLRHELVATVRNNHAGLAVELAYIAEFDDRKEYLPEGHPSMLSFCIHVLGFSPDSARKRIHAARAALQYPAIFDAVAASRMNLSAVLMIAPYLERGNRAELLEAVAHKTREEIDEILARRFPSAAQPMLPPVDDPTLPGVGKLSALKSRWVNAPRGAFRMKQSMHRTRRQPPRQSARHGR